MLIQILVPAPRPTVVVLPAPSEAWYSRPEWWGLALTGLSILRAYYLYRQAIKARHDSLDALKIARENAEYAKKSAGAAQASAETAERGIALSEESMHLSLRAYVVVDDLIGQNPNNHSIYSDALITIKNTGQTPAVEVALSYGFAVSSVAPSPNQAALTENFGIMAPHHTRSVGCKIHPANADEQSEVMAQSKIVFVHGTISYRDLFSETIRTTRFVYRYTYLQNPLTPVSSLNVLT